MDMERVVISEARQFNDSEPLSCVSTLSRPRRSKPNPVQSTNFSDWDRTGIAFSWTGLARTEYLIMF
jgi:hypothetical protein